MDQVPSWHLSRKQICRVGACSAPTLKPELGPALWEGHLLIRGATEKRESWWFSSFFFQPKVIDNLKMLGKLNGEAELNARSKSPWSAWLLSLPAGSHIYSDPILEIKLMGNWKKSSRTGAGEYSPFRGHYLWSEMLSSSASQVIVTRHQCLKIYNCN